MATAKHNADNERIKRRYFSYLNEAQRHSEPTVDAVAKALDRFEVIRATEISRRSILSKRSHSRGIFRNRKLNAPGRS